MSGRIGVVGANQSFQFAHDAGGFFLVLADDGQCADTFAIEREGLGERAGNEEGNTGIGKLTDGTGVFFKTVAEALIGDIKERNQFVLNADVNHLSPLFLSQVVACGVVAAGMQNHNGVFF